MKTHKKGTGWYMLIQTILSGGVMFCVGQTYGTDGAIIIGILLLITMASAIRYNL
jgi:hypothetical protein